MVTTKQDPRAWASLIESNAITGVTTDGAYYATNAHLDRAIGTGATEDEARFDLLDLAVQWAEGVVGAGDALPELTT